VKNLTKLIAPLALAGLLTGCGGNDAGDPASASANIKTSAVLDKSAADAYSTVVQQLYVAYFGRPADPGGLANLEAALLAVGAPTDIGGLNAAYSTNSTIKALIDSFGASAESVALYGTGNTSAFVTAIYQNVLGRPPLSAGLTFWVDAINSGSLTQADAALSIMAGAEANTTAQGQIDAALIGNKITVANSFTSTVPDSIYAGSTAAADARAMLGAVTNTTNITSFQPNLTDTIATINNQQIFESAALHGGESTLNFNIPFGGGNLVPGVNYIYSDSTGTLSKSPLTAGPQIETPAFTSLDSKLSVPAAGPTRIIQGGQVWLLAALAQRKISYVGSEIHVDYLASDGQTILTASQFSNYSATTLSGLMDNSPEEVLAAYPISDWISFNNFSANAQWQTGAGYIKKQGNRVGDTVIASDCTNVSSPIYTTGTTLTPCQSNTTLDNFFPINLLTNFPVETDFIGDGAISTVQGVRMWVANAPLALASSAVQAYRVFYEMNGNVYMGMIEKDGAPYNYQQPDGSTADYLLTLNQAAVNSVQQGIITGTVVPGSQAGSSAEIATVDLFGIGGHGVNGSLSPADLRAHYNVPSNLNGAGQTIVIIDPPGTGDVADDLNVFSQFYNLPQCNSANPCFRHIDLSNGAAVSSANDAGREVELDTQMAHGMAPAANIILITAASNSWTDLTAAMNYVASIPGATVVSMSFAGNPGSSIQQNEDVQLAAFQANGGPVFFASSGDNGYLSSAQYPASSPYVTAVGGTRITAVQWVSSASEVAWQYSSGGANPFTAMPTWQSALLSATTIANNNGMRAVPDVAAVADPQHSAVGTYFKDAWTMAGGTSASSPIWAGVGALFGQYLASEGKSLSALTTSTPGGFNGLIYQMKLTQGSTSGFYDILSGSNNLTTNPCAICTAITGYDDVTGLGAPNATTLFSNF
jgi:hypothetical protein